LGVLDAAAIEKVCAEAWPGATNPDEMHEALLLAGALTEAEAGRAAPEAANWLGVLAADKRAGILAGPHRFWIAAERLPLLRAVYPEARVEPALEAPASATRQSWERDQALRELVRGRMEISGPLMAAELVELFKVPAVEIEVALLALEKEGFVLRGRFRGAPNSVSARTAESSRNLEWCDRRLLARIHRLTLNRLRVEIQPVSLAEFQRFLLAWQRVAVEDRAQGPEGVLAVLEALDGYEVAAGAWEPEVLALRVKEYDPRWLDQLCFTGRVGWGRLTPPQNSGQGGPIRSSPVSLFVRENLAHWLALAPLAPALALSPDTAAVMEMFHHRGALFFHELVQAKTMLPSRVEQALAELAALGWVTSDSFEGLRALLLPQEKRTPFVDAARRRRHKSVTSVEFAGRWSLLKAGQASRLPLPAATSETGETPVLPQPDRDSAVEAFARALLRRYGVVFRRLLERESLRVSWFELGRVFRRLEARGEIRGGHFVSGVGGEQFALPEAVGLLRSLRKLPANGELLAISGADPLNLAGILTPGRRVAAITSNRLLLCDGVPVAALQGDKVESLDHEGSQPQEQFERALRLGSLSAALRPYYA
jgi:ATP-dependent Lhr-like helicase